MFLLVTGAKMAATAALVVAASLTAERVGALVGALVATLPIASWPAYVLLAFSHDAQFIADSTVTSLAVHAPTGLFCTAYVLAAQRWRFAASILAAVATWVGGVLVIRTVEWSLPGALVLDAVTYGLCIPLVRRFAHARVPPIGRRWFDLPLRAALAAVLVGAVVLVGDYAGPKVAGILTVFPIILLSLMIILHSRIGGKAAAAVIANTVWGLIGFGLWILALHLTVVPTGAPLALMIALLVSVAANTAIFLLLRSDPRRIAKPP